MFSFNWKLKDEQKNNKMKGQTKTDLYSDEEEESNEEKEEEDTEKELKEKAGGEKTTLTPSVQAERVIEPEPRNIKPREVNSCSLYPKLNSI